jgi:hypothetical protein
MKQPGWRRQERVGPLGGTAATPDAWSVTRRGLIPAAERVQHEVRQPGWTGQDRRAPPGTVTCAGARWRMCCLVMAGKRSEVRIPIAPQVRAINRNLSRRFSALYSSKYSSARTSAAARLFGFGLRTEYLAGPHYCCTRLSSRVASRNAMTLLTVASRGPRNGCYGDTRQLADLSVYMPPVQQVSRPAHGAAGSGLH